MSQKSSDFPVVRTVEDQLAAMGATPSGNCGGGRFHHPYYLCTHHYKNVYIAVGTKIYAVWNDYGDNMQTSSYDAEKTLAAWDRFHGRDVWEMR